MTANFGASWRSISGHPVLQRSLPNVPVQWVVVEEGGGVKNTAPAVFAGTDAGVYRYADKDGTWGWDRFDEKFPNVEVSELDIQAANSVWLAAATHGRGAWLLNLSALEGGAMLQQGTQATNIAVATFD